MLAERVAAWPHNGVVMLGEQHDADDHQALQRAVVQTLAGDGRLAALVLEMADQGRDTRHLPRTATEADVQSALAWNDRGWPWRRYGPVVMAAVQAGVPVLGGNLPRADMARVQRDTAWDAWLPPQDWQALQQKIQTAHCDLMPPERLPGMARIQLARDAAMAQTVRAAAPPAGLVLLVAGQEHVDRLRGVPLHLRRGLEPPPVHVVVLQTGEGTAPELQADERWITPPLPAQDHCAALRPSGRPQ